MQRKILAPPVLANVLYIGRWFYSFILLLSTFLSRFLLFRYFLSIYFRLFTFLKVSNFIAGGQSNEWAGLIGALRRVYVDAELVKLVSYANGESIVKGFFNFI